MEIIRRALMGIDPKTLAGTIVAVPIVNVHGFLNGDRYLPDRRNCIALPDIADSIIEWDDIRCLNSGSRIASDQQGTRRGLHGDAITDRRLNLDVSNAIDLATPLS